MAEIDPDQFIITRKRKKYKFAKFANAHNCFEFDAWTNEKLPLGDKVSVEIGAGTGLFCVELASRHPEKTFVAIDVKADRLQKGAYEALGRGVSNVLFVRARADQIDELFVAQSLESIWLTFSDPFPKKRSAGMRMTHPNFLTRYQRVLRPDGSLLVKHDNEDFFRWSLEQLVAEGWHLTELSFDLHDSMLDDDYKIITTYEQRWIGEGRITQLVHAQALHLEIGR